LFLLWMGWGMSKNPVGSAIPIVDTSDADSSRGPISAGIILSATNPYFFVWWATVGLSFIEESREAGTPGTAAFYTGHISSDIIWYAMVALAVSSGKKVSISPMPARILYKEFAYLKKLKLHRNLLHSKLPVM